jgi:hypothetical protein
VALFDTNGKQKFLEQFSATTSPIGAFGFAIAFDPTGNLFVTLDYSVAIDGVTQPAQNGSFRGLVMKIDPTNGKVTASQPLGGAQQVFVTGLAVDQVGHPSVAGFMLGSFTVPEVPTDAAPTVTIANSDADGTEDAFLLKFDTDLNPLWGQDIGFGSGTTASYTSEVYSVAIDSNLQTLVAGTFADGLTVGATTLTSSAPTPPATDTQAGFLASFAP